MAASMRPLTLGEILDHTVQLYRRNFILFAGISFLPAAFYVVLSGGAGIYFTSRMPATPHPGPPDMQSMLALGLFGILFVLIGVPLILGVTGVVLGALTRAAFQRNRGDSVSVGEAYAYAFQHFWRHIGIFFLQFLFAVIIPFAVCSVGIFAAAMVAALLAGSAAKPLAVLAGLLMLLLIVAVFVVCVWIWLRFCLAFPASVAEQKKAWPSLQRGASLSKGSRGRIFVMYLMVAILTFVAYYALTIPVDLILKLTLYKSMAGIALLTRPPLVLQLVNLFVNCLERTFVMPIYAIALLLFYNDQRTRKEGYDIEMLMTQAGWSELPQFAVTPTGPNPTPPGYAPASSSPIAEPTASDSGILTPEPPHPASEESGA
jgi:hypothetical protein